MEFFARKVIIGFLSKMPSVTARLWLGFDEMIHAKHLEPC